MAIHERTAVVDADPDDLFHLLAEVASLPDYMERVVAAERVGIERVRVTYALVDADGRRELVAREAWFRTDRAGRHLRWGTEAVEGYGGELEVTGVGEVAWVRVRVFTPAEDDTVEADLAATVARIRHLAESQPPPAT